MLHRLDRPFNVAPDRAFSPLRPPTGLGSLQGGTWFAVTTHDYVAGGFATWGPYPPGMAYGAGSMFLASLVADDERAFSHA